MEVVMRTLPSDQGGIADSLAILTRSVGIVGGATLLMLAFDIAKVEALFSRRSARHIASPAWSAQQAERSLCWAAHQRVSNSNYNIG
jgi:hypothetical protein